MGSGEESSDLTRPRGPRTAHDRESAGSTAPRQGVLYHRVRPAGQGHRPQPAPGSQPKQSESGRIASTGHLLLGTDASGTPSSI